MLRKRRERFNCQSRQLTVTYFLWEVAAEIRAGRRRAEIPEDGISRIGCLRAKAPEDSSGDDVPVLAGEFGVFGDRARRREVKIALQG